MYFINFLQQGFPPLFAGLPYDEFVPVLLAVAGYLGIVLVLRWQVMALPLQRHIEGELDVVEQHLERLHHHAIRAPAGIDPEEVATGLKLVRKARAGLKECQLADKLLWTRGSELKIVHYLREAERLRLLQGSPGELRARLHTTQEDLALYADLLDAPTARTRADYLAQRLEDPLAALSWDTRSELDQALRQLNEAELDDFRKRMENQSRATWVTVIGLGLILWLALAEGHALLFLGGAVGGFLGRLTRAVQRDRSPYLNWGSAIPLLLLSPVVGALAGWTGYLLLSVLDISLLGDTATWSAEIPTENRGPVLAVAVILGFSEALFNRLLGAFEARTGSVLRTPATRSDASPGTPGAASAA
jgi:hypothetical protein